MRPTRILYGTETIARRNLLLAGKNLVIFLISYSRLSELIGLLVADASARSRKTRPVNRVKTEAIAIHFFHEARYDVIISVTIQARQAAAFGYAPPKSVSPLI